MAGGGARGKRARRGGGDGLTFAPIIPLLLPRYIYNLSTTLGMQAHAALRHAPARRDRR